MEARLRVSHDSTCALSPSRLTRLLLSHLIPCPLSSKKEEETHVVSDEPVLTLVAVYDTLCEGEEAGPALCGWRRAEARGSGLRVRVGLEAGVVGVGMEVEGLARVGVRVGECEGERREEQEFG